MCVTLDDKGNVANREHNVVAMFAAIEQRGFMLDDHQLLFVRSLHEQSLKGRYLSPKQFKWLVIYYCEATSSYDMMPDPAEESD